MDPAGLRDDRDLRWICSTSANNAGKLHRITATDNDTDNDTGTLSGGKCANWSSQKALKDDETGRVIRGAVWYHVGDDRDRCKVRWSMAHPSTR